MFVKGWFRAGTALSHLAGRQEEAVAAFEKALAASPGNAEIIARLNEARAAAHDERMVRASLHSLLDWRRRAFPGLLYPPLLQA